MTPDPSTEALERRIRNFIMSTPRRPGEAFALKSLDALAARLREAEENAENMQSYSRELEQLLSQVEKALRGWAEVLETCLPTDEGYDDDTEQVLGNVIRSIRALAASSAGEPNE